MKNSINAYCFILMQTIAVMVCYKEYGLSFAIILTIGLVVATVAFVAFLDINDGDFLNNFDKFNNGDEND